MSLLIVGASARAAAQSAWRAGLPCVACDLFGDRDGAAERIDPASYPARFEDVLKEARGVRAWLYTGALENHPELIDRMAAIRPLWGISGAALRAVRDPVAVAGAMAERGLPAPGVRLSPDELPRDGSWLVKPRASAGGRRIRPLVGGAIGPGRAVYFQERIAGTSLAALFVGRDGGSTLAGVTLQLTGRDREPFAYAGSLGPWPVEPRSRDAIAAIGQALVDAFELRGLFGMDLILDASGRPFPVEVNPRYTASVEVLELATGRPLLAAHGRAFDPDAARSALVRSRPPAFVGKAILFADRRSRLPAIDAWEPGGAARSSFAVPTAADIPAPGSVFVAGEPVLTVMARGASPESCRDRLGRRLARWRGRLVDEGSGGEESP